MKKIFAIVFMIMMFCQTCVAFEPPDSSRWTEVARDTTGTLTCWVDTKTIRFEEKYGETYANVWSIMHNKEEPGYAMDNMEFNMDKREFRFLSITKYDDNGKVTASSSIPSLSQGIPPGSLLECLYQIISDTRNQNKNKSVVSKLNR